MPRQLIAHVEYAVTSRTLFPHASVSSQNDVHQLRQDLIRMEQQASEHKLRDLHATQEEETSKDDVCDRF